MTRQHFSAIAALIFGMATSPASWAHDTSHAILGLGHGPLHLALDLGQLLHRPHRQIVRTHNHGPSCYRSFPQRSNHWGVRPHHNAHSSHHRPQRGEHHANYSRNKPYAEHHSQRASHKPRASGHNRHSRDRYQHDRRNHAGKH